MVASAKNKASKGERQEHVCYLTMLGRRIPKVGNLGSANVV